MKHVVKSNKPGLTSGSHNFFTFKRTNKETAVTSGPNAKVCGMPEAKQQVTRVTYKLELPEHIVSTSQTRPSIICIISKMFWCPPNV